MVSVWVFLNSFGRLLQRLRAVTHEPMYSHIIRNHLSMHVVLQIAVIKVCVALLRFFGHKRGFTWAYETGWPT